MDTTEAVAQNAPMYYVTKRGESPELARADFRTRRSYTLDHLRTELHTAAKKFPIREALASGQMMRVVEVSFPADATSDYAASVPCAARLLSAGEALAIFDAA